MLEQNKSFTQFFSKNCGFPKGNALGALCRVRNLIVQAHLGVNLSIQVSPQDMMTLYERFMAYHQKFADGF